RMFGRIEPAPAVSLTSSAELFDQWTKRSQRAPSFFAAPFAAGPAGAVFACLSAPPQAAKATNASVATAPAALAYACARAPAVTRAAADVLDSLMACLRRRRSPRRPCWSP